MSIASLISRFGRTFHVFRPAITSAADGTRLWTYSPGTPILTVRGFMQPATQAEDPFEGRANSRTSGTLYIEGANDIRIDDEIYEAATGTTSVWRVRGVVNPAELGTTGAASHLNMTVVDVVEVAPDTTVTAPP